MATLCEMMVFSVNGKFWNSAGFRTGLASVVLQLDWDPKGIEYLRGVDG